MKLGQHFFLLSLYPSLAAVCSCLPIQDDLQMVTNCVPISMHTDLALLPHSLARLYCMASCILQTLACLPFSENHALMQYFL